MPHTLTTRRCRPGDVGVISKMARDLVETGLRWTWTPLRVAQTLGSGDALGVVASREGEVIGFCLAIYRDDRLHIVLLAVAPSERRGGVGAELLDWHLACAAVAGCRTVTLELRATNQGARRFYERFGFQVVGRLPRYYQGREDALRMRLERW